jgi:Ca2+-binding RTX toxin-like protein
MHRLTRAALGAVLLVTAIPGAAQAATVDIAADNTILYRAANGETNSLLVRENGNARAYELVDSAGLTSRSGFCSQVNPTTVRCGLGFDRLDAQLGDRSDSTSIRVSGPVTVDGGDGNETFFAGMAPGASRTEYRGSFGVDTMTYAAASAGVRVTQNDVALDGRTDRGDRDNVRRDIEHITGSPFDDVILASRDGLIFAFPGNTTRTSFPQQLGGGAGNDSVNGGANMDFHFMGGGADGRDTITGGANFTRVDYGGRGLGVNVTVDDNLANDGAAGEGDDVRGGVEELVGGRGRDTLEGPVNASITLVGGDGGDTLEGGSLGDTLIGDGGGDTFIANGGNDFVSANDGIGEQIGCGTGTDTADIDSNDVTGSCETPRVGVLRLTPKALRADAGEVARVGLSWRHPKAWRQLTKIELRLTDRGAPVGEITIRPRSERVADDGAIRIKQARIAGHGKTITAKLALRLDKSLADRTLKTEVEATDTRGARQLERDAGTVRVAG